MPELPEVETVVRGLALHMSGRRIAKVEKRRPDLRSPMPRDLVHRLTGRRVETVRRRAKYILIDLDDGTTVIGHLGMSGRITIAPPGAPVVAHDRHDHVVLHLDDGSVLRFNDPRRFGQLLLGRRDALDEHAAFVGIGPEPFDAVLDAGGFAARLAGKRTPIKAAILDQRVIAGVGNIYACEAMFVARIAPERIAATVTGARAERLLTAIRDVLTRAIAAGGSSLRDYVQTSGELGYFQHAWAVYGREGERCTHEGCRGTVRRAVQGARSTFYCARCQR